MIKLKHWADMLFSCNCMTKLLPKWRLLIVGSICWVSLALMAVLLDFEHPFIQISQKYSISNFMWRRYEEIYAQLGHFIDLISE
jgi:hypothetical protein